MLQLGPLLAIHIPRIKVMRNSAHSGINHNRNVGQTKASNILIPTKLSIVADRKSESLAFI